MTTPARPAALPTRRAALAAALGGGAAAVLTPVAPSSAQQRGAAPAAAPPPPPDLLRRVEAYFNGLTTLKARFLQAEANGGTAQGTAWIWRPGRMRFEYDPPVPLLLVASDGQFLHYDRELRQPSVVPVSSTPLAFLLRPNLRLAGDVTVTGAERSGGFLRLTLHRAGAPAEGRLTLVLEEEPTVVLRQWVVEDAQRRQTRVTLTEVETGGRFDSRLFAFNDPRFLEDEAARR